MSNQSLPANAVALVREYLLGLQKSFCDYLKAQDPDVIIHDDPITAPNGALSQPRVINGGKYIEQAAAQFTHSIGDHLPAAATIERPNITGWAFQSASLSWIFHPRNPHAPTTHGNLRFFVANNAQNEVVWWFAGGFDLTPFYGYKEDAIHWHQMAKQACEPCGEGVYEKFKKQCDDYFFLEHRKEPRGIGGLFFDDWNEGTFEEGFSMMQSIGNHFLKAYGTIFERRKDQAFTAEEKSFQLYRRGRYVEFNLIYDRGTKYGIQSGRRIEAVMASMPPEVNFRYNWKAEAGTREAELMSYYLVPRDWVNETL
jgi:coproporphyrinogen III oxidase